MLEFQQNDNYKMSNTASELKTPLSENEVSCTPLWMYKIGDAMSDISSTDQLPDGYATNVGYGERFRNSEYLPLFTCYPFVPFLIVFGCLISLGGIAFGIYRWRTGTTLDRYANCKISKESVKWFYVNYILVVVICIFLTFAVAIMLIANNNISEAKEERALQLELVDRSIQNIINNTRNNNFEEALDNFNERSTKLLRAIEIKAQPYLGEVSQSTETEDFMMYRDDIKELLDTFDHANAYMLHFLDSWRYYDTNATRFAKAVATMDSRRALQALRQVRKEFANVVYKVIQQNRAFHNYYQQLERVSEDVTVKHLTEASKKLIFANTMSIHMKNVEDKLERLGSKLHERAIKMKDTTARLQKAADGAGYIEFPSTLLGFGYFLIVFILLIVLLSLSFLAVWFFEKYFYRIAVLKGILPLITVALIFACYLIFVLAIMYYFLYGMVATDGICEGKRSISTSRSSLIDDCFNNSNTFEAISPVNYDKDTTEIEKVLKEIENISKRRARRAIQAANDFETLRINKTIIQDIYVEMLKVAVYAPKNIEPFGRIWQANRFSTNKILKELNCTHAIGNTMASSLHGQVANEMDKLYRTTWRIEAMLRDLPKQLKANGRDEPETPSAITNIMNDLQTIFGADKIQLRTSLYGTTNGQFGDCKDVAQIYKSLTTSSCKCMVRSMNLFWIGAVVAVFILLLLLILLLWLDEMLRRSCLPIGDSKRRRNSSRARGRSRTRSTSRPGTAQSSRTHTPYSTRNGTPYSTRPNTPYSSHPDTPYSTRPHTPHTSRVTPHTSRPNTPYSSHLATPYSSHSGTPYSSQRGTPHTSPTRASRHSSKHATPYSTRARSLERTPTRGISLAQKLPPFYDPYLRDYSSASCVEQAPLAEPFTERLSRRDVLPRHQQKRKHHYPSLGNRDITDYLTYESYPELPNIAHQSQQPIIATQEQQQQRTNKPHVEPKRMWKNDTFRYPGLAGSDLSTSDPNNIPRSISKVIERRRAKSHPSARHTTNAAANDDEQPSTSRMNEQAEVPPLPPGKVGIVLCPCGCGKPSKIYGTKDDIDRIRKAGRICIAKRGEHLRNKHLRPLASIVQLCSDEPAEDNV